MILKSNKLGLKAEAVKARNHDKVMLSNKVTLIKILRDKKRRRDEFKHNSKRVSEIVNCQTLCQTDTNK